MLRYKNESDGWMICNESKHSYFTLRSTRSASIRAFVMRARAVPSYLKNPWDWAKRKGYYCSRVVVKETK